jgi:hypothetical protein
VCNTSIHLSLLTLHLPDYIPQGHRFDILEDIGCFPSTYNTWVAYVLVFAWPLAIGVVSAAYSSEFPCLTALSMTTDSEKQ